MRSAALRLLGIICVGTTMGGCSDSRTVTAPASETGQASTSLLLPSPTAVNVVTRDVALATPQTASAWVGLFGGRISLPGAGLSVFVPPFAVTSPTQITVTAVAGRQVAYEFEPHGKQFLIPLWVTQSLSGTSASANGLLPSVLYGGYFQNVLDLDQVNATGLVTELLSTSISSWKNSVSFGISHFSGYLVATGLNEPEEDEGFSQ